MPKKMPKKGKPEVHKKLKGFEISVNEMGEVKGNVPAEKLNEFLTKKEKREEE